MTADGTIAGLGPLREAFTGLLGGLFAPGTYEFSLDAEHIAGEVACASSDVPLGVDTFLVRGGKIAVQTFAAKIDPR